MNSFLMKRPPTLEWSSQPIGDLKLKISELKTTTRILILGSNQMVPDVHGSPKTPHQSNNTQILPATLTFGLPFDHLFHLLIIKMCYFFVWFRWVHTLMGLNQLCYFLQYLLNVGKFRDCHHSILGGRCPSTLENCLGSFLSQGIPTPKLGTTKPILKFLPWPKHIETSDALLNTHDELYDDFVFCVDDYYDHPTIGRTWSPWPI